MESGDPSQSSFYPKAEGKHLQLFLFPDIRCISFSEPTFRIDPSSILR